MNYKNTKITANPIWTMAILLSKFWTNPGTLAVDEIYLSLIVKIFVTYTSKP